MIIYYNHNVINFRLSKTKCNKIQIILSNSNCKCNGVINSLNYIYLKIKLKTV